MSGFARLFLSACCLLLMIAAVASGQEWTRFRGPNGSGLSDATLPLKWIEKDYNWKVRLPGVGHFFFEALIRRDYPVVQSINLFFATFTLLLNLIVDFTYAYLDPRIRFR